MLSCKEVSRIVSKSLDQKLSMSQRVSMWMHLMMCGLCSGFRKDLVHLQQQTKSQPEPDESVQSETSDPDSQLSIAAKDRMKRAIEAGK